MSSKNNGIQIIKMYKAFPLKRLDVWEDNPRKNDQAVAAVERSLSRFGPVAPIIADEKNRICAGETRYKAATQKGLKSFPVIICRFPDESSFVGYNIADNQTASLAEWDVPGLSRLVKLLSEEKFDLGATALDDAFIKGMMEDIEFEEIDDVPRLDEKQKTVCPKCGYEF